MTVLGAPAQATLWEVHYRHLSAAKEKPPEPRAKVIPSNPFVAHIAAQAAAAFAAEQADPYVTGRCFVLMADPTGADLYQNAKRSVLGEGSPDHEFSIVAAQRVSDSVKGHVQLDGWRA